MLFFSQNFFYLFIYYYFFFLKSYCGAENIEQLQRNAEFVRITDAGKRESESHDVSLI